MDGDVHDIGALMPQSLDLATQARLQGALDGIGGELSHQRFEREQTFGVLASMTLELGRIGDALDAQLRHLRRIENERAANTPIYHNFVASGLYPTNPGGTAPPLVLNCGGPSVGRIWHVKRLVVGGLTLATVANGSAEVYSSGWIPDAEQIGTSPASPSSLSDLVDATILIGASGTKLPNIANYEDGEVVVRNREKLWVVIRSGTSGQQYVVAGTAKDLRVMPYDTVDTVS